MKFRGLAIAALVLLILGGALYWSGHRKPSVNKAVSANASPTILNVDESAINQLTLKKKDAEPVTLVKTTAGVWQITKPRSWGADQNTVKTMLAILSPLNSERVVEQKATNLKQYGLDQPDLELDVAEKDQKTHKILFGDDSPTGGTAYTMLAGDPSVFTVLTFDKTGLDKSLNDLRDTRLLTVDSDKISSVEFMRKGEDIGFRRNGESWQIVKPKPLRADYSQVDTLVRAVTSARMDLSGTRSSDASSAFARGTPIATVKVTDGSVMQVLQLRKDKDGYYAKSSAVDGAYKLASNPGMTFDKSLDDFRNKSLFDFGFNDPDKVELHNGSKTYLFTRSGQDWLSNGKKMDAEGVESLVSQLRALSATKFPDSGFTTPEIQATVTSGGGKQVEKVLISKSGKDYIAKRANEPSLYELDASAVDAINDAAGAVKTAAAPKK